MIIEWRKGGKSLFGADKSALQKPEGAFCFYIIETEIVKFRERNLLANQRFAVEILKFRLSIVVIMIIKWRKGGKSLFGADKSALQKAERGFLFLYH